MRERPDEIGLAITEHGPTVAGVPDVILVHGAMDRARSFRPVVTRLPDLRIVTYDRRGYGESIQSLKAGSLTEHADDLLSVMGTRPTAVVAHSFGCRVAVAAAIAQPQRFTRLGLWEPQVPWMDFWPLPVRKGLETMAAQADTEALAERAYVSMVGEVAWRELSEDLKRRRRAEGLAFQADVAAGLDTPFRWADLRVPCLMGVGLKTWPFALDAATRLATTLDAQLFTVAGAAHSAHISHPDEFAQFVRRAGMPYSVE